MGFRIFGSFLILTLLCTKSLFGQRPNTDESFILEFLREMGLKHPQDNGFSGPFCSWRGLLCDDSREHAIELELSDLGLSGPIPDSTIGKLTKLTKLDLSVNKITALPSDLWDLGSLHSLNLSHNQITGSLSSNIVNFGQLQSLDLSFNNFSGSIPEGISSLPDLQVLNLSRNGFESSIPLGISQCKSLVAIDLSENSLTGPLPNGFGAALPQLRLLSLAGNGISGRDSDFSGMRLNHLNLSGNVFKGSLVGLFGGPLEVIDLSRNQFEGHIPQANFSSNFDWSTLVYLDLSENYLSGEFFTGFNRARILKHLNLAFNRFTEQQFILVDTLSNLEYLNLSSTNLIGLIPSNVSYLAHLRTLDLSRNQLSSRIPLAFTNNLEILDLSYNNLTGEIPLTLIDELHRMEMFNFSYNNLSFCGTQFPQKVLQSAFIRSINSCPIAANPDFFRKKSPKHEGLKIALVLTISIVFLLVGLLVLAFRFQWKTRMGAVKQNSSYREEQSVSGPFSFQTDLTTWVADVKQATSVPVIIFEKPLLNFTFSDLLSATSNFDRATLLAEGRFGPVYSGLLPGGIHVAVKVLVNGSTMSDEEAAKELEYLGRIKHPNLVPLTGYCLAGDQRIAIYEYMENGNLQNFLHDLPFGVRATEDWSTDTWEEENSNGIQNVGLEGSPAATWQFRHKIALGSARALAFLHHGCSPSIIHRDVRTSSVYLDLNLEPRLSDFGLAKIFGNGLDEMARGPPGYLPPEFVENEDRSPVWDPTPKSDVYGFGVVLFELVTGKRPVEDIYPEDKEGNLVRWVRGLVRMNLGLRAIDPKIRGTGPDEQIVEALKIGYLCTAELPSKRPSMQQVVGLLKDLEQIKT